MTRVPCIRPMAVAVPTAPSFNDEYLLPLRAKAQGSLNSETGFSPAPTHITERAHMLPGLNVDVVVKMAPTSGTQFQLPTYALSVRCLRMCSAICICTAVKLTVVPFEHGVKPSRHPLCLPCGKLKVRWGIAGALAATFPGSPAPDDRGRQQMRISPAQASELRHVSSAESREFQAEGFMAAPTSPDATSGPVTR